MEEIKQICNNYKMGFISPLEFLNEIRQHLSFIGADKSLDEKMSEVLVPLAAHVLGIVDGGFREGRKIDDFEVK